MKKNNIAKKLNAVLKFIKEFTSEHGYPPSVREMCTGLNIPSTASIYYYLNKLEQDGKLTKSPQKNRAINICKQDSNPSRQSTEFVNIPHLGKISAGIPITAIENIDETYSFPRSLFKSGTLFMLTIKGNSMTGIGIYDGDKVVIKSQPTAQNGDIVAALVGDEATIKRFYQKDGHIVLHPENHLMEDIVVDNVQILGIATGLIRKL
jgi:repressor LexA